MGISSLKTQTFNFANLAFLCIALSFAISIIRSKWSKKKKVENNNEAPSERKQMQLFNVKHTILVSV